MRQTTSLQLSVFDLETFVCCHTVKSVPKLAGASIHNTRNVLECFCQAVLHQLPLSLCQVQLGNSRSAQCTLLLPTCILTTRHKPCCQRGSTCLSPVWRYSSCNKSTFRYLGSSRLCHPRSMLFVFVRSLSAALAGFQLLLKGCAC